MHSSATTKRAFVSYRHESEAHRKEVLAFCHRLAAALGDDSVELVNDQTLLEIQPAGPDEGWNRWSMNMAAHADNVIAIASPGWFAALDQKELEPPPGGIGSAVEATVIFNRHTHGRTISPWLRLVRLPTYPKSETNWLFRDIPIFGGTNEADIQALSRWIKGVDRTGGTPALRPAAGAGTASGAAQRVGESSSGGRPRRKLGALIGLAATAAVLGLGGMHFLKNRSSQPAAPAPSPPSTPSAAATQSPVASPVVAVPAQAPPSPPPEAPTEGGLWEVVLAPDCTLRFRWCPPGSFTMGRTQAEFDHLADFDLADHPRERRRIDVTINQGFWMAETELSLRQLSRIRGVGEPENGTLPATGIPHAEARQVCEELNRRLATPGLGARLPTEAEWEYACRAGSATIFSFGDVMDATMANFDSETAMPGAARRLAKKKAVAVGSYRPNNWNIFDMHGNVSEWCALATGPAATDDDAAAAQKSHFPARGGHWNSFWIGCTSGAKNYQDGSQSNATTGVRLMIAKPPQP